MIKQIFSKAAFAIIASVFIFSIVFSGAPNASATTGQVCPTSLFSTNLTVGSSGSSVEALQKFLSSRGFLTIPAGATLGGFGPLTKAAVAAYQTSKNITPSSGYFGPLTRAAVNADCASGSTSSNSALQLSAATSTDGSVHVNASFDTSKYNPTAVSLSVSCPENVDAVYITPPGPDWSACNQTATMNPTSVSGAYQSVFQFTNNTGSSQTINFQAAMNGPAGNSTTYGPLGYTLGTPGGEYSRASIVIPAGSITSSNEFNRPSINVTTPINGTTYKIGDNLNIKWVGANISKDNVMTFRLRGYTSGTEYPLDINSHNDGNGDIAIPSSIPLGKYIVDVKTSVNGQGYIGSSEGYITITATTVTPPPSLITVTTPVSGATYKVGDNLNIKWSAPKISADNLMSFKLRGYTSGTEYSLDIASHNDGNGDIIIPSSIPVGQYTLAVQTSVSGQTYTGTSSAFTISAATPPPPAPSLITVTNPASGSTYQIHQNINIKWSAPKIPSTNSVTLSLRGSTSGTVYPLNINSHNDGNGDIIIPTTIPAGQYVVDVKTIVSGQTYTGTSGVFTITGLTTANTPPTVQLSASPVTVLSNSEPRATTLSWTSTNATSCSLENQVLATSGSIAIPISASKSFTVSCTGSGGSASSNPVTVNYQLVTQTTAQPVITSISPTLGAVGTTVTVNGTGFVGLNQIVWTGQATDGTGYDTGFAATYVSSNKLTFVVPSSMKPGTYQVSVLESYATTQNPTGGIGSNSVSFTVPPVTITPPPSLITVTVPTTGATYMVGNNLNIKWSAPKIPSTNTVTLSLRGSTSGTVYPLNIASHNDGNGDVVIPTTIPAGQYVVDVKSTVSGQTYTGTSGAFTVTVPPPPSITLVAPNGGESLSLGKTYTISWTMPSDKKYFVSYYLMPQSGTAVRSGNGTFYDSTSGGYSAGGNGMSSATSNGSANASMPRDILPGTYKLRVYLRNATEQTGSPTPSTALAYDDSDAAFNVVAATAEAAPYVNTAAAAAAWQEFIKWFNSN